MDVLGVIPARGGSKGIPHKNIAMVAGQPLLAYTCKAALSSKRLTRVILSTDDPAVAAVGRRYGTEVPFLRPEELAKDDVPMLDVLQHVLKTLQETENYQPEVVVLLQPTSPLRRAEHIDEAVDILLKTGADSVVSVVEVPHQFSPVSVLQLEGGRLRPYVEGPPILRRQDKPLLYARNGPAVLAVLWEVIILKNSLYGGDCRPLVMEYEDSIDVDGPPDLERVEFLLKHRGSERHRRDCEERIEK
jgi:CMP-N-acetylneuraminic acid synthetase